MAFIKTTGVRPHPSYGNPLDQKRYIFTLDKIYGKNVLDIASGVGWGSYLMASAGANVLGLDASAEAIEYAKSVYSHKRLRFELTNGKIPTFDDRPYDVVTSFETLEHVNDPYSFLAGIKDVCSKSTTIYLSTPNAVVHGSVNSKPKNPYHKREYTKSQLFSLLQECGFQIIEYLGQGILCADTDEIQKYKKFNADYWANIAYTNKYSYLYKIFRRMFLSSSQILTDPALGNPDIQCVPQLGEPVYHFLILRCI